MSGMELPGYMALLKETNSIGDCVPINMPKERSCTLARTVFFFIRQTLIDLLLCIRHWAGCGDRKVGRVGTLKNDFDSIL